MIVICKKAFLLDLSAAYHDYMTHTLYPAEPPGCHKKDCRMCATMATQQIRTMSIITEHTIERKPKCSSHQATQVKWEQCYSKKTEK